MVADKFPRRYVAYRGREGTPMISSLEGIARYIGVSVNTVQRMAERQDDPLPLLRSDAVRGVWIEEAVLRAWMERHGLLHEPEMDSA